LSKGSKKVAKKLPKNCHIVVKKLSKSCQKSCQKNGKIENWVYNDQNSETGRRRRRSRRRRRRRFVAPRPGTTLSHLVKRIPTLSPKDVKGNKITHKKNVRNIALGQIKCLKQLYR
jgi:hypothetical protein